MHRLAFPKQCMVFTQTIWSLSSDVGMGSSAVKAILSEQRQRLAQISLLQLLNCTFHLITLEQATRLGASLLKQGSLYTCHDLGFALQTRCDPKSKTPKLSLSSVGM